MRIESKTYIVELNEKTAEVNRLYNKLSGDENIKYGISIPVFFLNGFDGETWSKLLPTILSVEGNQSEQVVKVQFGGKEIFADIRFFVKSDEQLGIKINIVNKQKDFRVCETVGPNIYGLRLGSDYKKNVFVYPHHAGEKTVNPMDRYRDEEYQHFFRAFTKKTDYNTYIRQINYCGLASMSFMYLYDDNNGLYFGSHDHSYPVTTLTAEVGSEQRFMGLSFTKHYDFCLGECYDSGEYVLNVNDKDWHCSREIYRAYIADHLIFHNYPDYLDDEWGLNQCYNFKRQGNVIQNYFKDIPRMYEKGKSLGLRHMFIASWNRGGFDTDYPEYYPDMDLGSGMDFVRGLRYVKDHGGMTTLYINARIFDEKSLYANTVGNRMAIVDREGKNMTETYGIASFTISCPSDDEWNDRLTDTSEYLVHSYGATGVYLDQLGSAEPFACYNKHHSHKHIGEFNNGYVKALKRIHERIQSYDKRTFILTENIGDLYASYTFGNLTWNSPNYDECYNVIRYIFPEFVQIHMVNPKGNGFIMNAEAMGFVKKMERAVLLGAILWYSPTLDRVGEQRVLEPYAEKVCAFRSSIQPYIKGAVFEDEKYIVSHTDGVNASVFETDEQLIVLVGNSQCLTDGQVVVKLNSRPKQVTVEDIDLQSTNGYVIDNNTVKINVQGKRLYCLKITK